MKQTCRHYHTGELVEVYVSDGRLDVRPAGGDSPDDAHILAPGLIDLQLNGFVGVDFNAPGSLTQADIRRVVEAQWALGVTHFLPTVTTNSFDHMRHAMRRLVEAMKDPDIGPSLPAIHMEGPYISQEDGPRGAHPKEHARAPDWDEFARLQEAAEGAIRLVTLSPEYDEAEAFIRRAVAENIAVAIGHTKATSDQIRRAVDAGASLSTHLGNGSHAVIQRHPNYIWDQLAEDRLWASLIVDGHHLPPSVVKTMIRAKTSDRVILVSDSVSVAGLDPGVYTTLTRSVELTPDGAVRLAGTPYLSGAALEMPKAIENTVSFAGVDFARAIDMASVHPVKFMETHAGTAIPHHEKGSWTVLRRTDHGLEVVMTAVAGRVVHQSGGVRE